MTQKLWRVGASAVVAVAVVASLLPVVASPVGADPIPTYREVVLDDSPLMYFPLDVVSDPHVENLGSTTSPLSYGSFSAECAPGALASNIGFGVERPYHWTFEPDGVGVDRSVEFWVKFPGDADSLVSVSSDWLGLSLDVERGRLVVASGSEDRVVVPVDPTGGLGWRHIGLTRSGTELQLFLNGELIHTEADLSGWDVPDSEGTVVLTSSSESDAGPWVDEVAVFDSVLSASSFTGRLSAGGRGGPYGPTNVVAVPGDRAVEVSWDAPVMSTRDERDGVLGYRVVARLDNNVWMERLVGPEPVNPAGLSTLLSGLEPNVLPYSIEVSAINPIGESPVSSATAVVTGASGTFSSVVHDLDPVSWWRLGDSPVVGAAANSISGSSDLVCDSSRQGSELSAVGDGDGSTRGGLDDELCTGLFEWGEVETASFFLGSVGSVDIGNLRIQRLGSAIVVVHDGDELHIEGTQNGGSQWVHVALARNGNGYDLVVDGEFLTTLANVADFDNARLSLTGFVDELVLFPDSLTLSNVESLLDAANRRGVASGVVSLTGAHGIDGSVDVSWDAPVTGDPLGYIIELHDDVGRIGQERVQATETSLTLWDVPDAEQVIVAPIFEGKIGPSVNAVISGTPDPVATGYGEVVRADSPSMWLRFDGYGPLGSLGNSAAEQYASSLVNTITGVVEDKVDYLTSGSSVHENRGGAIRIHSATGDSDRSMPVIAVGDSGPSAEISVEFWGKWGANGPALMVMDAASEVTSAAFFSHENVVWGESSSSVTTGLNTEPDHEWHHYVLTSSALQDEHRLYVDGQYQGSFATSPWVAQGNSPSSSGWALILLGAIGNEVDIDELAVYPHALTNTQVNNHFLASGRGVETTVSVATGQQVGVGKQPGLYVDLQPVTPTIVSPSGKLIARSGSVVLGEISVSSWGMHTVPVAASVLDDYLVEVEFVSDTLFFVGETSDPVWVSIGRAISQLDVDYVDHERPVAGETFEIVIDVTAGGVTPTGTVEVFAGSTLIDSGVLTDGQVVVEVEDGFEVPSTALQVVYSGDAVINGSSTNFVVEPFGVVDVDIVTAPVGDIVVGAETLWTVEVDSAFPGWPVPTGQVQAKIDETPVASSIAVLDGAASAVVPVTFVDTGAVDVSFRYLAAPVGNDNVFLNQVSDPVNHNVVAASTVVELAVSGTLIEGQDVTLTATVSSVDSPLLPQGVVTFFDGDRTVVVPVDEHGVAVWSTVFVAGSHDVVATFTSAAGGLFTTSGDDVSFVVAAATSLTVELSGPTTGVVGSAVGITAQVVDGNVPATGVVGDIVFERPGKPALRVGVDEDGVGVGSLTWPISGSFSVQARFETANAATALSDPHTVSITKREMNAVVSFASDTVVYGQSPRLNVSVGTVDGVALPSGMVRVHDSSSNELVSFPIGSGQWSRLVPLPSNGIFISGNHNFTVTIDTDVSWLSWSTNLRLEVVEASAKVNNLAAPQFVAGTSRLVVPYSVKAVAPSDGSPDGRVELWVNGEPVSGTQQTVETGAFSVPISMLPVAPSTIPYQVQVNYLGTNSFQSSLSNATLFHVGHETQVTASVRPPGGPTSLGAPVTIDVGVTSATPGVPTGQVVLYDNDQPVATAMLDPSGYAVITTEYLNAGNRDLTVKYGGDPTVVPVFGPSTSPVFNHTVDTGNNVAFTVDATTSPVVEGKAFYIQFSTSGSGSPYVNPTGTVEVFLNNVHVGTTTLDADGQGSYRLHGLGAGVHELRGEFTATPEYSSVTASDSLSVSPVAPLTLSSSMSSQQGVAPFTTTLTLNSSHSPSAEVVWTFGDGSLGKDLTHPDVVVVSGLAGSSATHEFSEPGIYRATVVVEDDGQSRFVSHQVKVSSGDPLVAAFGGDRQGVVNRPVHFDASASLPAFGDHSFAWDFGDGSTAVGAKASHSYTTIGEKTVTLTVTSGAESAVSTATVHVQPIIPNGAAGVTVSSSGVPVEGASVVINDHISGHLVEYSDAHGVAIFNSLSEGVYTVHAIGHGFQPTSTQLIVGATGGEASVELVAGDVGGVSIEHREMSIGEVVELGLDPYEPENQLIYEYEIVLPHRRVSVPVRANSGQGSGGGGSSSDPFPTQPGCSWSCTISSDGHDIQLTVSQSAPVVTAIVVPVQVGYVKQFFEVSMSVTNFASHTFDFVNGELLLTLPEGLSLAPLVDNEQSLLYFLDVAAGQTETLRWIVRGDTPGSHHVTGSYAAVLDPTGLPVSLVGQSSRPIQVHGPEKLGLVVESDTKTVKYEPMRVNISLVNNAESSLDNAFLRVNPSLGGAFLQPKQQQFWTVDELLPNEKLTGELILVPAGKGRVFLDEAFSRHVGGFELPPTEFIGRDRSEPMELETTPFPAFGKVFLQWEDDGHPYDIFVLNSEQVFDDEPIKSNVTGGRVEIQVAPEELNLYAVSRKIGSRYQLRHNVVPGYSSGVGSTLFMGDAPQCAVAEPFTKVAFVDPFYDVIKYRYLPAGGDKWLVHDISPPSMEGTVSIPTASSEGGFISFANTNDRATPDEEDPDDDGTVWSDPAEYWGCEHEKWHDRAGQLDSFGLDGDPVNTLTGALWIPETDLESPAGITGLDWTRRFDSGGTHGHPTWSFSYSERLDITGEHVTFVSSSGRHVRFIADSNDEFIQPSEFVGNLVATSSGYRLEYPDASVQHFNSLGQLIAVGYRDGSVSSLTYDGEHRLDRVVSNAGNDGSYFIDVVWSGDQLVSVTTNDGYSVVYGYDLDDNLVSVTHPGGLTWSYTYDDLGRVTSGTEPSGVTTFEATYGPEGRVVQQKLASGVTTEYTYQIRDRDDALDGEDHVTQARDATDGSVYLYHYDNQDRLIAETNQLGHTHRQSYDSDGLVVEKIDATGGVESFTYTTHSSTGSKLLTERERFGVTTSFIYDTLGREVSQTVTGTDGVQTLTWITDYEGHDPLPSESTGPDGAKVEYSNTTFGRVAAMSDNDGVTSSFSYDAYGRLIGTTDAANNETVLTYDNAGRIASQTTAMGRTTSFVYNSSGQPVQMTDSNGGIHTAAYDAFGRLVSETNPEGETTTYTYHPVSGLMWKVTDPLSRVTEMIYDHRGNMVKTIFPDLSFVEFGYDVAGQLIWERDETGAQVSYDLDPTGRVVQVVDPVGVKTTTTYDSLGRNVRVEHDSGRFEEYGYDAFNRVVSVTTPEGTASTSYDSNGRVESTTDDRGVLTTYTYSAAGRLLTATENGNRVTTYSYDNVGRIVSVLEPGRSAPTTFTYDADGLLTSETSPEGAETNFVYDAAGRLISTTDPADVIHTTTYDDAGRVVATQSGDDGEIEFTYDAAGQLVSVLDALGNDTEFFYDLRGRVIREEDALGNEWQNAYDLAGRLTEEIDPLDRVTELTYDIAGRLTERMDHSGRHFTQSFDSAGRVDTWQATQVGADTILGTLSYEPVTSRVASETVNGATTSYVYDEFGALITTVSPDGRELGFSYDVLGRRTMVRGVDGYQRDFSYDSADRLVSVTSPHFLADTFTDVDGAALDASKWTTATRGGATVGIEDNKAKFTLGASSSSSADLVYKGEVNASWQLNFTVDLSEFATNANFYTYGRYVDGNNWDRVEIRGNGDVAVMRRRGFGNEVQLGTASVDADVVRVSVVVEAQNLKLKVWDVDEEEPSAWDVSAFDWLPYFWGTPRWFIQGNSSGAGSVTIDDVEVLGTTRTLGTYTYNNDDQVLTETFGATGRTYTYDTAGRLSTFTQTGTGIARSSALTYNDSGRAASESTNGVTRNFTYDTAGQVTATTGVEGPRAYTYDELGRRVSETIGGQSATFTYNNASELLARTVTSGGGQSTTYGYDPSGRRISETVGSSTKTLSYDALGRLSSVVEGVTTRNFGYNSDGLVARVTSTGVANGDAWLDWDDHAGLVGVNTHNVGYSTYTGNNGMWGVRSVGSNVVGVGTDWMGSVLAAGPGGNQATSTTYDVYGREAGSPGTGIGASGVSVGFRGEVTVDDQVLLRARVYDPATGQFLTQDPVAGRLGFTTISNPYHYADNDPIGRFDPTGMVSEPIYSNTSTGGGNSALDNAFADGPGKSVASFLKHHERTIRSAVIGTAVVGGCLILAALTVGAAVGACAMLGLTAFFAANIVQESCIHNTTRACFLTAGKNLALEFAPDLLMFGMGRLIKITGKIGTLYKARFADDASRVALAARKAAMDAPTLRKTQKARTNTTRNQANGSNGLKLCPVFPPKVAKMNSFSGDTHVLMGDGTTKRIDQVATGDTVYATDPETGTSGSRIVEAVWVHEDELVALITETKDGQETLVYTTLDHPFWNKTDNEWQQAQTLDPGDQLQTADNNDVTVVGLEHTTSHTGLAYNLTIRDTHTYHIQTGDEHVLVHNTGKGLDYCGGVQRIALGLGEGLEDFATSYGAMTYRNFPGGSGQFVDDFYTFAGNPKNDVLFNLDGVKSPWSSVQRVGDLSLDDALQAGASITDWELAQIYRNRWSHVQFFENGQSVGSPFR